MNCGSEPKLQSPSHPAYGPHQLQHPFLPPIAGPSEPDAIHHSRSQVTNHSLKLLLPCSSLQNSIMAYCGLPKTPSMPLLSRRPAWEMIDYGGRAKPRCSSLGPPFKTCENATLIGTATRALYRGLFPNALPNKPAVIPRYLSNWLKLKSVGHVNRKEARFFSTASQVETQDKQLPWIAAYKEREAKQITKAAAAKTRRSSWEESADRFLSRNGGKLLGENIDVGMKANKFNKRTATRTNRSSWEESTQSSDGYCSRNGSLSEADKILEAVEEEEKENADSIDDRMWDKTKSNYTGFTKRESCPKKPEVRRWSKQENWGRKTWKEATESSVPKMVGQAVYAVGPVLAALTVARREFYALYVQERLDWTGNNRKKKDKKGVEKVLRIAEKIGLKVIEASKHDLNMVVDNRPHQGLVLDASPLEMVYIRELETASLDGETAPLWVALDEVTDPQNLGAIVRSAYFFGAKGVVLCAKNSAPLSGVVSKASAGSLELIELRSCKNMMQFLSSSVENGWRVLGGSVSSKAVPLGDVEAGMPTILVLGSEGSGLRPLVERSCTELIKIHGNIPVDGFATEAEEISENCSGQELKSFFAVESLNVSVAAGVLLYHLVGNNKCCADVKLTRSSR